MQKFLRLSLIVAIILSCSWHARDAHSASTTKMPLEIPMQIDGGMPTIEVMVNGKGPFVFDTAEQHKLRVVVVARGLSHPWSIAFLPDGEMHEPRKPYRAKPRTARSTSAGTGSAR